ncbi:uncharacterized protein RCO7_02891 [Rhynchosporium graminicola]|uniref:Uncharacterized protein n=1 Tax=Rhynchosporium graminicola TaxID=2792576 RepID=A0A1E1LIP3_9HELO|nr:uncharacterized protein RCO7_02891 [Rhynchosporium commune]
MLSTWQSFVSREVTPTTAAASIKKVRFEVAGRTSQPSNNINQRGLSVDKKIALPSTTKSEPKGILITSKSQAGFFDEIARLIDSSSTFLTLMVLLIATLQNAGFVQVYGTDNLLLRQRRNASRVLSVLSVTLAEIRSHNLTPGHVSRKISGYQSDVVTSLFTVGIYFAAGPANFSTATSGLYTKFR